MRQPMLCDDMTLTLPRPTLLITKLPRSLRRLVERTRRMLEELQYYDLSHGTLDELVLLSALAKLLTAEYGTVDLDVPPWLPKRQREIERNITRQLEAELERAAEDVKALEEKETKRQAAQARLTKLQARLKP